MNEAEIYRGVLRRDYAEYVKYVHNGAWIKSRFHGFLCKYVQNFIERKTDAPYEILVIHSPPQHGKSATITETLPSWYLGKYPENRVIEISYNKDFAIRFGRRNKRKIVEFGKEIFGIEISKEASKTQEFELANHSGGMLSAGVGTSVTGQRANLLIIDDPIKNRAEANSKARRDLIYDEWLTTFRTRLAPHSKVILIMTRWHEDDLAGRLLDEEDNIKYLRFPCECEDENDLLRRAIGDSLCPDIGKDKVWLQGTKATMLSESG